MPMMISLRKQTITSTLGHTTAFEASNIKTGELKPAFVHPLLVPEATKRGCVMADGEDNEALLPDNDGKLRAGFETKLRRSLLAAIMQRLVNENQPKNFDSGQVPKLEVLSKILGFDVDPKERKEVWQAFSTASASGEELDLHPDATKVLDILDAEGRAELVMVAQEQGATEDEIKGLQTRDLRKHLLAKYAGLTTG